MRAETPPDSPRLKSLARRAAGKARALKRVVRTVLDNWQRHGCRHPHAETLTTLHTVFSTIVDRFGTCAPLQASKAARELEDYRLGIVARGQTCVAVRLPTDKAGIMVCHASKYAELSCGLLRLLQTLLREGNQTLEAAGAQ